MADRFAINPHNVAFFANMAVSVDFDLHSAITKNTFGDDGNHVDAFDLLRNNKRRGLVVRIRGASTHSRHKRAIAFDDVTIPVFVAALAHERHQLVIGAFYDGQRI